MNKSSTYQNIIENYKMTEYNFTQDSFNEKALMSIIFSKFITDTIYTNNAKRYIDFILKENYIGYYQNFPVYKPPSLYSDHTLKIEFTV